MQFIKGVQQQVVRFASENSAALLTAAGVVGTVGTAVLAGRSGYKANEILAAANAKKKAEFRDQEQAAIVEVPKDMLTKTEKLMLVGPQFLPPLLMGGGTIAAIIFANRISAQKAAALVAAYGLAERNLSEYKEKVSEKITGPKQKAIEDELAQDAVNRTPGHGNIVLVEGDVLCFDKPTGRYFRSTMDNIKRAVNATNAAINDHDHVNASFFYEELDMPATTWTDEVGWDHIFDLTYSTVLTEDGKPCIAIDFRTLPKVDYIPKHY